MSLGLKGCRCRSRRRCSATIAERNRTPDPDALALGRCIDKKLIVVPEEAETVRTIFRRYLELGSIGALVEDLDRRGTRTKAVAWLDGSVRGGIRFGEGPLQHLLRNRFYLGEIVYCGEVHAGEHEPIIDRNLFEAVEVKRAAKRLPAASRTHPNPSV
jgi:site-specific DNA recombinase